MINISWLNIDSLILNSRKLSPNSYNRMETFQLDSKQPVHPLGNSESCHMITDNNCLSLSADITRYLSIIYYQSAEIEL